MLRAAICRSRGAVLIAAVAMLLTDCSGSPGSPEPVANSAESTTWATQSGEPSPAVPAATPNEPGPAATTAATVTSPAPSASPPRTAGSPLVVLNPGHNGGNSSRPDIINAFVPAGNGTTKACDTAGTTTVDGYPEHAFTFDVATQVAALLTARGVRVELTRADDTSIGPCVSGRADLGNSPDIAAAVVSIHADGAPEDGHGFHISQASIPPAGPEAAAASDRLTTLVHDAMDAGSGLTISTYLGTNGYFPRGDLAGLNLAQGPATFLECGNMKNPGDAALLASPEGRAQIAGAIADGILAFLGG